MAAYSLTLTNGTHFTTVPDSQTNVNASSLTLIGKNYAGYGAFLNENMVHLLENFSNSTEPAHPLVGQLWYNSTEGMLKVYTIPAGQSVPIWKNVSSSTTAATEPDGTVSTIGDVFWDATTAQLKVYNGDSWVVIGPSYTNSMGHTGVDADLIGGSHVASLFWVNNKVVAIMSKEDSYTLPVYPAEGSIVGFTTIHPGINLVTDGVLNYRYNGTASNADSLGGVSSSSFIRNDQTGTTTGALTISNNSGLTVGTTNNFSLSTVGTEVKLNSAVAAREMNFYVNRGAGEVKALSISGAINGDVTVNYLSPTTNYGVATKYYVDNSLTGANFLRNDQSGTTTGTLTIANNSGLTVGISNNCTLTTVGTEVKLSSTISGREMNFYVERGAGPVKALSISGTSGGDVTVNYLSPTTNYGVATKYYVDNIAPAAVNLTTISTNMLPQWNGNLNIGSGSLQWNTVYATTFAGTAVQANYADLAERFESDQPYSPGTVVELGGSAEITSAAADLSENVFGVISTRAAYLMNSAAGTDSTHPPVAMQGRVPVRVTGKVAKGDRLVSAGNGLARAASRNEITPFNVIGRSLTNKSTTGEGTVEAIVKLNS